MLKGKSSRSMFGIMCLSVAVGMLLYWVMFMNVLPRIMRPEASRVLPLVSGAVGALSCALIYFAVINLAPTFRGRSKAGSGIVLVRNGSTVLVKRGGGAPVVKRRASIKVSAGSTRASKPSRAGTFAFMAAVLGCYVTTVFMFGTLTPFMAVPTGSMAPEFNIGDFVLVKAASSIKVGDIIVFHVPSPYEQNTPSPIVHRVVEIHEENGVTYYRTKGDNNPDVDPWMVPKDNVIGVVVWKAPMLGYVILYLRNMYVLASVVAVLALWTIYPYLKRGGK